MTPSPCFVHRPVPGEDRLWAKDQLDPEKVRFSQGRRGLAADDHVLNFHDEDVLGPARDNGISGDMKGTTVFG